MRLKTVIIVATALGAAAFFAGGLYYHYSTNVPEVTAGSPPARAPATATRSGEGFSFAAPDNPKPLPELTFVDGDSRVGC